MKGDNNEEHLRNQSVAHAFVLCGYVPPPTLSTLTIRAEGRRVMGVVGPVWELTIPWILIEEHPRTLVRPPMSIEGGPVKSDSILIDITDRTFPKLLKVVQVPLQRSQIDHRGFREFQVSSNLLYVLRYVHVAADGRQVMTPPQI